MVYHGKLWVSMENVWDIEVLNKVIHKCIKGQFQNFSFYFKELYKMKTRGVQPRKTFYPQIKNAQQLFNNSEIECEFNLMV